MSASSTPSPSSPTIFTTACACAAESAARPALRARRSARCAAERFAITAAASLSASSAASETRNRSTFAVYAPRRARRASAASHTLVFPVRRGPATTDACPASSRVGQLRHVVAAADERPAGSGESVGNSSPLASEGSPLRAMRKAYT